MSARVSPALPQPGELAKQGLRVVLLEKGLVGAEQSSRNWGWCRQQNRDERELPLSIYALQRWNELERETGEELGFRRSGLVYATQDQSEIDAREKWGQIAKQYGVESHIPTASAAKAMTPGSSTARLGGVSSPTDGYAEPARAAPGLVRAATARGAMLFPAVRGARPDISGGVISGVWTERGLIKTSRVIVSAGARTSMFCRRHGIDLPMGNVIGTAFRTRPIEQAITVPFIPGVLPAARSLMAATPLRYPGRGRLEPGAQGIRYARQFWPTFKSRRKNLTISAGIAPFFRGRNLCATGRLTAYRLLSRYEFWIRCRIAKWCRPGLQRCAENTKRWKICRLLRPGAE